MNMRRILTGFLFLAVLLVGGFTQAQDANPYLPDKPWESIDVVIALDTSGSMKPLLDAARLKLWEIVNDLAGAEPTPHVRVAFMTYGHAARHSEENWVKLWTPFTDNLDLVSQRLFEAKISGDTEYVARVLEVAFNQLEWTESDEALRLLFVVGNEAADQDPMIELEDVGHDAIERGIVVNAIFCGSHKVGTARSWKRLAEASGGHFATIDHRRDVSMAPSPFDKELAELSEEINSTYLPLGVKGQEGRNSQMEQDRHARKLDMAAAAARAQTKASVLYNTRWDLLSALESGELTLQEVPEEDLPQEMQIMSFEEREIYIEDLFARRDELRQRIQALGRERRRYVSEQARKKGHDDSLAFDSAIRGAMRQHATDKGFSFPDEDNEEEEE
jgi:hypothetical protein